MSLIIGLEEKIRDLITISASLREENKKLFEENSFLSQEILILKEENKASKCDNAGLVEEVIRLESQLRALEESILQEKKILSDLDTERSATKVAVDDLIKSINTFVECECP